MKEIIKYYLVSFYFLFKRKDNNVRAINSAFYYYFLHWILIGGIILVGLLKVFPGYKQLQAKENYKTYFECFKLIIGVVIFSLYIYTYNKARKIIMPDENIEQPKRLQKWICYSTLPVLVIILALVLKYLKY
ncbi:hypothetical protein [Mucilaginibacter sp. NFX135]|uniref:hypothetical protein n=1 Tax=Mucilaginibacter sp. NFX135 TaxID=3402687 RepID=UPI003AFA8BCD